MKLWFWAINNELNQTKMMPEHDTNIVSDVCTQKHTVCVLKPSGKHRLQLRRTRSHKTAAEFIFHIAMIITRSYKTLSVNIRARNNKQSV